MRHQLSILILVWCICCTFACHNNGSIKQEGSKESITVTVKEDSIPPVMNKKGEEKEVPITIENTESTKKEKVAKKAKKETKTETVEEVAAYPAWLLDDSFHTKQVPEWAKDAVIYEVNLRQYTQEGTIKAFMEHLPRLKDMGVDILWFMPIHPIGEEKRKGSMGSYYSVKDFKAIDLNYGTIDDFKAMVAKAHELEMYVLLDWVANHSAWDNSLRTRHPSWYTVDENGNNIPPVADWSDVVDFNYEEKGLWKYMIESMKFWVEAADIDGYRCDVAEMVPLEFWNLARKELDKVKPVFMLAEAENPNLHEQAFDMTYAWELHHLMNGLFGGKNKVTDLDAYIGREQEKFHNGDYRMLFTSNHDENSWNGTVYERLGASTKTFATLSFVLPGMPLIYSGQEAGNSSRLAFFDKEPIQWKGFALQDFYKDLIDLKKRKECLWNGEHGGTFERIKTSHDDQIFAFKRRKNHKEILCIFNLSHTPVNVTMPYEIFLDGMRDAIGGDKVVLIGENKVSLKAWGYMVLE